MNTVKHQGLDDDFAVAYLLSLLTALANRRFLLLAGHVGVGKSHLLVRSGEILGSGTHLIPVRPGWLDPSDLMGYFDPLAGNGVGTFRESPFTEILRGIDKDEKRPRLILLDEMNIARVENYAADLLTALGASNETIRLHAGRKESDLAQIAKEMLKEAPDNEYRKSLEHLLKAVEGKDLPIPTATLFCGTLNMDGSTEDLSPKMLDRSFLLRFPRPNLKDRSKEADPSPVPISVEEVRKVVEAGVTDDGWEEFYKDIQNFEDCLIPLSRRVRDDYAAFVALGRALRKEDDGTFADNGAFADATLRRAFAFARILPRVAYDPVVADRGKQKDEKATAKLKRWLDKTMGAKDKGADAIGKAAQKILDSMDEPHVSYQRVCG